MPLRLRLPLTNEVVVNPGLLVSGPKWKASLNTRSDKKARKGANGCKRYLSLWLVEEVLETNET